MTLARNIVFSATVYWKFQKMIDGIHLCSQVFAQHTNVKRLDRVLSSCVRKCCQHCCQVVVCVRVWGGWWRLLKHTVKDSDWSSGGETILVALLSDATKMREFGGFFHMRTHTMSLGTNWLKGKKKTAFKGQMKPYLHQSLLISSFSSCN